MRKTKTVMGKKGAAKVNAETQISLLCPPNVQALIDANIKLMKKLAELKAENIRLQKKAENLVDHKEMER